MPTYREDLHLGHSVPLVETDDIMNKAVTTVKLDDGAVTVDKLADDSVTPEKIAANAVTSDKLQDDSVGSDQLAPNAVTSNKLQDESVGSEHIAQGAVTRDKLAPAAITDLDNATADANAAATHAERIAEHPTYVGEDNYVYEWNDTLRQYEKTDIYVKGEKGDQGATGNLVYPQFEVTDSMHLMISDGDNITLENGHLMVDY